MAVWGACSAGVPWLRVAQGAWEFLTRVTLSRKLDTSCGNGSGTRGGMHDANTTFINQIGVKLSLALWILFCRLRVLGADRCCATKPLAASGLLLIGSRL